MSRALNEQAQREFFGDVLPRVVADASGTFTPDCSIAEAQQYTMGAATLIAAPINTTGIQLGSRLFLVLIQGGAGTLALTFNAAFRNPPAATAGGVGTRLAMEFRWDGAKWQYTGGGTVFA